MYQFSGKCKPGGLCSRITGRHLKDRSINDNDEENYYIRINSPGNHFAGAGRVLQAKRACLIGEGHSTRWKPTQKPNNHWTNWESGNLYEGERTPSPVENGLDDQF
jgi:hypothetical protein